MILIIVKDEEEVRHCTRMRDRLEARREGRSALILLEAQDAAAVVPLLLGPVLGHGAQLALDLQNRLVSVVLVLVRINCGVVNNPSDWALGSRS